MSVALPLLVATHELAPRLGDPAVRIVDLSRPDIYVQAHIPGALHLDYARIVAARPPVMGLLPGEPQLTAAMAEIGLQANTHVVAYDEEGGGKAARLLWTLDAIGHRHYSLLDGGIHAWIADQEPVSRELAAHLTASLPVSYTGEGVADIEYLRAHLDDPGVVLLDCRTPGEFSGEVKRAERAGHIKGAVNYDWINAMDRDRQFRLRPREVLLRDLAAVGVTPDKEVIVYCQTHHRSAHTYVVLKHLGFPRIKGYPGSWSEWGNRSDTPIEP